MKILATVEDIKAYSKEMKEAGKVIGLVPTMGALHEGHLTQQELDLESANALVANGVKLALL